MKELVHMKMIIEIGYYEEQEKIVIQEKRTESKTPNSHHQAYKHMCNGCLKRKGLTGRMVEEVIGKTSHI